VSFHCGDACNLPSDLGQFGCVLAANLICRLPNPYKFLDRLPSLVAPGGILVLTTPFSWSEEFTPKVNYSMIINQGCSGIKKVMTTHARHFISKLSNFLMWKILVLITSRIFFLCPWPSFMKSCIHYSIHEFIHPFWEKIIMSLLFLLKCDC